MKENQKRFTVEYKSGARESLFALDCRVAETSIIFKMDASRERFLSKSKILRIYQWKEISHVV